MPFNSAPAGLPADFPGSEPEADPGPAFSGADDASMDTLLGQIAFAAEPDPEAFFRALRTETAAGHYHISRADTSALSPPTDTEWELDWSLAGISGEGFGEARVDAVQPQATEFLKTGGRGRKARKREVLNTGLHLSIDPEVCLSWAQEVLAKGWFCDADLDDLIAQCSGDGEAADLKANLHRALEGTGLAAVDLEGATEAMPWDFGSDVSAEEMAEAIEATLTRATRLPGTNRFKIDKKTELQMLSVIARAEQELQLHVLGSGDAVKALLAVLRRLTASGDDADAATLRAIACDRPEHVDSDDFDAAIAKLVEWQAKGCVMDGKSRREALAALRELDLSLSFQKAILLLAAPAHDHSAGTVPGVLHVEAVQQGIDTMLLHHLPYVRRFAARNSEDGEDPEDVFQVAFIGLRNSLRRFDPKRGHRFLVYAAYWMRQAVTRWRHDQGREIRIPVHWNERLVQLDRELARRDLGLDNRTSDEELAGALEWPLKHVRRLRGIPRFPECPDGEAAWDDIMGGAHDFDAIAEAQAKLVVNNALDGLDPRQADVLRKRFGIETDETMTLDEIGQERGVTRERVRQIEAAALRQLSLPSRGRGLRSLLRG